MRRTALDLPILATLALAAGCGPAASRLDAGGDGGATCHADDECDGAITVTCR